MTLALTLVGTATLAAAYANRLWIAERVIAGIAAQQGFGPMTLVVSRLDLSGIIVDNISTSDGRLAIDRAEAKFAWRQLMEDHVNTVALTGLRAKVAWNSDGIEVGDTLVLETGTEGANSPSPVVIDHIQVTDANIEITRNQDVYVSVFDVEATQAPGGWDTVLAGSVAGPEGSIRAEWKGVVDLDDPLKSNGRGAASFDAGEFVSEDVLNDIAASGRFDVFVNNNELQIHFPQPIDIHTSALPAELLQLLPAEAAAVFSQAPNISIFVSALEPIWLRRTESGFSGWASVQSGARVGSVYFGLAFKGDVIFRSGAFERIFLKDVTAEVSDLPLQGALVNAKLSLSDVLGPDFNSSSQMALDFDVRKFAFGEVRSARLAGNISSALSIQNSRLNLESISGLLDVRDLEISPTISLPGLTTLRLASTDQNAAQSVSLGIGLDGPLHVDFDLGVSLSKFSGNISALDETHSIDFDMPTLRASGRLGPNSHSAVLEINIDEAEVKHELAEIDDIRLNVFLREGSISGVADLRVVEVGGVNIQSAAQRLDLRAITTFREQPGEFSVTGGLQARNKSKFAEYSGRVAADGSTGNMVFRISDALLGSKGAIDTAMLSAFLPVTDLSGVASLNVNIGWTEDELTHSGALDIKGAGLKSAYGAFTGLSTRVELDSLWPPMSRNPQRIVMDSLAIGIPVTKFDAEIEWPGNGSVVVNKLSMDAAGGHINAGSVSIPFDNPIGEFILVADGIDVSVLAALADVEGLEVNGLLSGSVPIQFSPEDVLIIGGKLSSIDPGFVRYQPVQSPAGFSGGGGGSLLLQALEDFRYDSLNITANGSALEEMDVALAFQGYNPDLYDGYPISFNLSLNGKFLQLMRQGLTGYRLPETLRRRDQQE